MIYAIVYEDEGEYNYMGCNHKYIAQFPNNTTVEQMIEFVGTANKFEVLDLVTMAKSKPEKIKPKPKSITYRRGDAKPLSLGWSKNLQEEEDRESRKLNDGL